MTIASGVIELRDVLINQGYIPNYKDLGISLEYRWAKMDTSGKTWFWHYYDYNNQVRGRIPWDVADIIFEAQRKFESGVSPDYTLPTAQDYSGWIDQQQYIKDPDPAPTPHTNWWDYNQALNEQTVGQLAIQSIGVPDVTFIPFSWLTDEKGIHITGQTIRTSTQQILSEEYYKLVSWDEAHRINPNLGITPSPSYTPTPTAPSPTPVTPIPSPTTPAPTSPAPTPIYPSPNFNTTATVTIPTNDGNSVSVQVPTEQLTSSTLSENLSEYLQLLAQPAIIPENEPLPPTLNDSQLLAIETDCKLLWAIAHLPVEQQIRILVVVRDRARNLILKRKEYRYNGKSKNSQGLQRTRRPNALRKQRKERKRSQTVKASWFDKQNQDTFQ